MPATTPAAEIEATIRLDERERCAQFIEEVLPHLAAMGVLHAAGGNTADARCYEAVYVFTEGLIEDLRRWDGTLDTDSAPSASRKGLQ